MSNHIFNTFLKLKHYLENYLRYKPFAKYAFSKSVNNYTDCRSDSDAVFLYFSVK